MCVCNMVYMAYRILLGKCPKCPPGPVPMFKGVFCGLFAFRLLLFTYIYIYIYIYTLFLFSVVWGCTTTKTCVDGLHKNFFVVSCMQHGVGVTPISPLWMEERTHLMDGESTY